MVETLRSLSNVFILVFIICSMFNLGLKLTLREIFEPLKRVSLVARAVLVNFVVAPLIAYILARTLGINQQFSIGLLILGVAAGSPFAAKLSAIAKGDLAYTAGLMVLLQLITIVYAPFILMIALDDIEIDSWGMVQSLVSTMLIPLAAGLIVRARYKDLAQSLIPHIANAASVALILQFVSGLFMGSGDLLSLVTTGALAAATLFTVLMLTVGFFMGGPTQETRVVTGLVTAQRSVSAALLIAAQNFADVRVLVMVLTGAGLMLAINAVTAAEFGKRLGQSQMVKDPMSMS
ncbi:MAG: bile acid:sodium symporter [Chloroflexota bacterium]